MLSRKYLLLFSFVLILAVSGCGKKGDVGGISETALKEETPLRVSSEKMTEENLSGPVVRETTKMIAPETGPVFHGEEILVSDFEGWPNNLGGEMGVYGALEPDWQNVASVPYSWVYEPIVPGYDPENVHKGNQSFRLVNGLGLKPAELWGSFAMDLGPTTDITVVPKRVESLDASGYKYLTFWIKGEKGGEKAEVLVRDAHALNYTPQIKYKISDLTAEWQKIVIPLDEIKGRVDLSKLDNIGIAFGKDVGNTTADTAYIDDFVFTNQP